MRRMLLQAGLCALLMTGCKGDPNTPQYWEKTLKGAKRSSDRVRVAAQLRASPALSNPSFLPFLHAQLATEKNAEVRTELVRILGDKKDKSSVQPLQDALDFGNVDSAGKTLNKEITYALARIGDPQVVPTFVRLLKNNDPYTRIAAVEGLGTLKAPSAVDALVAMATDEGNEPFLNKKAIQALGEIGDPKAVPALVKMMFKERKGISFYMESSFALFQLGTPAADALVPVVTKEDKALWSWAKENNILEPAIFAKTAQVLGDLQEKRAEPALLSQLHFESDFLDLKLFVRMKAADALGRMRSKAAVKPLTELLGEAEANARQDYTRALVWIGGRDALPALLDAAAKGSWDARETALRAASLLGDERELETFAKLEANEPALTEAECKEDNALPGCNAPAELAKKHVEKLQAHTRRLTAAKECKEDAACWLKKLDDADWGIRERAGYELGRSGKAEYVAELFKRLPEKNLEARFAYIQAAHWLIQDSKDAAKQAGTFLQPLEKQIAEEKGKTDFVRVNEDLRRLAVAVRRSSVT